MMKTQITKKATLWLLLGLAMALIVAACGTDSDDGGTGGSGDASEEFNIATYNAGLAQGFVDLATERAPLVFDAVGDLAVDVVAVQEVWTPEDVAALEAATADSFGNSFFLDPQPDDPDAAAADDDTPPCSLDESKPLEDCARLECDGVADDQLSNCVLTSCGDEFSATCEECQTCLAANIGGSLDDILDACTKKGGGSAFAYGGAFGIGLLSAEPFVEQDSLVLESSLTRRAVLHVQIDDPVLGTVNIFNTHLTANLDLSDPPVPYPGDGSWSAEQAAQIETAHSWIDERTSDDEVTIFVGDMNNSPEGEQYSSETPDNYELLVEGDWVDAYVDDPDAECTYCNANLLVGIDGGTGPMLDHVLVENFDGDIAVKRILTEPVDLETDDGTAITTNLSDHYGLEATLTPG